LNEVWRVDPDSEFGRAVLPMLEAVVLDRSLHTEGGTGSVELEASSIARMRSDDSFARLQRVFGDESFVTTRWLHSLLDRLAGIGSVAEINGGGIGTGFLVQGSTLSDQLGEDWYFVTNSHVVTDDEELIRSAPANKKPRRPEDVEITFEAFFKGEDDKFKVEEVIFSSPPDELDVAILRLDRPAYEGQIEPYPASVHLKEPGERPRLYIAGHPGGLGLRISMHDNHLIDFNDHRMHYRTPTNPGSSGSPVFNDQWKLVGLHHAGSSEMPKLDGSGETIEANEGIRLGAILEGLGRHLGDEGVGES
jgi:S1-C subfamily serine protease